MMSVSRARKFSIETPLGVRYCHLWVPVEMEPSAMVCVIHGLGEHGGRYAELAEYFAQQKWGTLAIDLVGHGLSPGWRGCVRSYEDLLEDISSANGWLVKEYAALPIILFGHSMGGNLVLNYLLRREPLPRLAIATGPMLRPANPPSRIFIRVATMLASVCPHFRLKAPVRAKGLTHDVEQQQAYQRDALIHRKFSLRLGAALLESGQWALDNAQRLPIPTLVAHGGSDTLTCPRATEEFARRSNSMCTLKVFDGLFHDIHREIEKSIVLGFFAQWIHQHMAVDRQTSNAIACGTQSRSV